MVGRQGAPRVLTGVEWHLQLTMSESSLGQQGKDATALFDFTTARPSVLPQVRPVTAGGRKGQWRRVVVGGGAY